MDAIADLLTIQKDIADLLTMFSSFLENLPKSEYLVEGAPVSPEGAPVPPGIRPGSPWLRVTDVAEKVREYLVRSAN